MNEYNYLCETQSRIIKVLEAENDKLREENDRLREMVRNLLNEKMSMSNRIFDRENH